MTNEKAIQSIDERRGTRERKQRTQNRKKMRKKEANNLLLK
jgi:hypothetical protein